MTKHNLVEVGSFWRLLSSDDPIVDSKGWIKSLVFGEHSIAHSGRPTHKAFSSQVCLWRLTALRLKPFWLDVAASKLFFITSHLPLHKWIDFVMILRWKFGARVLFCFFVYSAFFKWFFTAFWATFSSWAIETVLAWWSNSTISLILSTFSIIGLLQRGSSFISELPDRKRHNQNCVRWTESAPLIVFTQL